MTKSGNIKICVFSLFAIFSCSNLAHASMLQHPISTDCNSDGIPISSRRNSETISKEHRDPKTSRLEKYLQRYYQSHSHPPPLAMPPPSRLIARNLLAFTLLIMRLLLSFCFLKIVIATDAANLIQRQCKYTTTFFLTVRLCQTLIVLGRLQPP